MLLEWMERETFDRIEHPLRIQKIKTASELELELPQRDEKHLQKFYNKYYSQQKFKSFSFKIRSKKKKKMSDVTSI